LAAIRSLAPALLDSASSGISGAITHGNSTMDAVSAGVND
jgi:hypothetical protein